MSTTDNVSLVQSSIAYLKRIESEQGAAASSGDFLSLAAGDTDTVPVRLFSHEAAVFYVYDDGNNFTYVTDRMRDEAGLSREQLHEVGLTNLAGRFPDMEIHQGNDMLVVTGDENFEASMILLDRLWDQLSEAHFPNGPIAALPARDVLGLCDADSSAIDKLRATVQKMWEDDAAHLLARALYRRGPDGAWEPIS